MSRLGRLLGGLRETGPAVSLTVDKAPVEYPKTGQPTGAPGVGGTVHYVSHGTPIREDGKQTFTRECRAATITEAPRGNSKHRSTHTVGLAVANPTGMFFHPLVAGGVRYDPGSGRADWSCDGRDHEGGTWHWPASGDDGP